MSNFRSFNLDIGDSTSLDEVVESMIQHRIESVENENEDLKEENRELNSTIDDLEVRLREVEDELVKERRKYED